MMTHMEKLPSVTYDSTTGRVAESDGFRWDYLAGSNLKSSLTYPNEAVVTWTYEPHRDLLTAVTNATYSTYIYTNDLLGRRTSKNDEQYGYNVRDELISADNVSYAYDDIGNRTTAEGKTYTANNLNQYTAIDDFVPQYDADGNQTLIKTETGVWSVVYNAENRPIRWTQGDTVITMAFDRMGRRVEMRTQSADSDLLQRFVYDSYLCIQQLRGADNALFQSYVWDPTEPIATRPLIFLPASDDVACYFHDGNKNVSDLVSLSGDVVHYDYTPFGTCTTNDTMGNPIRFSSEMYDDTLSQSYYNFRHYNPLNGRWGTLDPLGEMSTSNGYLFINNRNDLIDVLGLWLSGTHDDMTTATAESVLTELMGCNKNDTIKKIAEIISEGNQRTDKGMYEKMNEYHYNRRRGQDPEVARDAYSLAIGNEIMRFFDALEKQRTNPNENPTACSDALDTLGRLTHMFQDYYAHGINPTAEDSTGSISGCPLAPMATPSSWDSWLESGEHGCVGSSLWRILTFQGYSPEPGDRAPDRSAREELAEKDTRTLLSGALKLWLEVCPCQAIENNN